MSMRILVVDDESFVRDLVQETLRARRYTTAAAASGEEALEILAREAFDIVVTDMVMPGMNGLELVKRVKRQWPRTRLVVLTGFPRTADISDLLLQGADDLLPKPFRAGDLVAVLQRVEAKIRGDAAGHAGGDADPGAPPAP
jgi:CheY-like chemotaxis protein